MIGREDASQPLRSDVLAGRMLMFSGPWAEGPIAAFCTSLGADGLGFGRVDLLDEAAVAARLTELAPPRIDALIVDAGAGFTRRAPGRAPQPVAALREVGSNTTVLGAMPAPELDAAPELAGLDALRTGLDGAWVVTRAVADAALIAQDEGGTIVYVAPRPGAGPHAEAARAGVENLARTLSIEWARHEIRPVAILPGDDTAEDDVERLVAYLVSPAGTYFSGSCFRLGDVTPAPR